jgi:hypothetical protein
MKSWLISVALALAPLLATDPALAEPKVTLGWGRLFNNDAIGDGKDRWHTGSYTVSMIRGTEWTGVLPDRLGEVIEYRLRADTVAPADLAHPAPGDRRYAGTLSLGVHSQADFAGTEVNVGADLVVIGPQTGISGFQSFIHRTVGMDKPNTSNQIGNEIRPTLSGELGRNLALGDAVTLRPYLGAQAGVESWVRLGGDLVFGHFGAQSLMLRDDVTGQRYRGVTGLLSEGTSFTLGGDVARVFYSAYLPAGGPAARETRTRLRAGLQWQGHAASVFYGATYLSPEFVGQSDGQIVGSLNINFRF